MATKRLPKRRITNGEATIIADRVCDTIKSQLAQLSANELSIELYEGIGTSVFCILMCNALLPDKLRSPHL